jgi:hypothetical protein
MLLSGNAEVTFRRRLRRPHRLRTYQRLLLLVLLQIPLMLLQILSLLVPLLQMLLHLLPARSARRLLNPNKILSIEIKIKIASYLVRGEGHPKLDCIFKVTHDK